MSRRLPTYSLLIVGLLATFSSVGCKSKCGKLRCNHGSGYSDDGVYYEMQPGTTTYGGPLHVPPTPFLEDERPLAPVPDNNTAPAPPKPMPKAAGNGVSFPSAYNNRITAPMGTRFPRTPNLFNRFDKGVRKILKPATFRRSHAAASQQVSDPFFVSSVRYRRLTLPVHATQAASLPPESLTVGHTVVDNRPLRPVWLQQPNLNAPNPWETHLSRQASPSNVAASPLSVPSGDPSAAIAMWPHSPRVLAIDNLNARPIAMPITAPIPTQQPTLLPTSRPQQIRLAAPSLTVPQTGL